MADADKELDSLLDRVIAEVMAHSDPDTIHETMERVWDEAVARGEVSHAMMDGLAFVGLGVLARERLGGQRSSPT